MLALVLALSLVGLSLGPVLGRWARGRGRALAALEAATLALVPGVILLRLLPHVIEDVGVAALIGFALGYVALQLAEATSHRSATAIGLAVVLPALTIHAFFDGASLAAALDEDVFGAGGTMFAAALLVHRIPEGLFLASVMSEIGARRARWGIVAITAATLGGGLAGHELLHDHSGEILHVGVAVGLGIMLRLSIHRHDVAAPPDPIAQQIGGLSFVLCAALVVLVPGPQVLWEAAQPHELSIGEALVPLFLETAPVVLGLLAVAEIARAIRQARDPADPWIATTVLGAWVIGPCLALVGALSHLASWLGARRAEARWWHPFMLPHARVVLPSYCIGVVLAVVAESALPAGSFEGLDLVVIPAAALIGASIPLGVGAPLVAAILIHKGAPLSAAAAFLIAAAARGTLRLQPRLVQISAVALAVAVSVGLAPWIERFEPPALHEVGRHAHGLVEWIAVAVLGAWIVIDLARFGPRAWLHRDPAAITRRT